MRQRHGVAARPRLRGAIHAGRAPQRGVSIIGFLFTAAVLIVIALVFARVLPSYVEYYTVQKALEASLADQSNQTPQDLRRSLERRLSADYVDAVRASDLTVSKEGNTVVASLAWQKILHIAGNASILLDFEATANR
jgi:hypothetical protein